MNKATLRNEIVACGRDPCYFIRKYAKIQHPVKGLIPFAMFDYQEKLIRDYQRNRFNIVLKARQLGISEVTAAFATWLMLFHRDKNIIVMASKAETAKNIIRKVQTCIKNLPKWLLLAEADVDNKMSVELSNGSRIKAIATTGDAGRSEAVSLLIVDEAAFIERFDELWTGLYPTVQAGGRAIILSTPNGVGNKFHQLFVDADAEDNDFFATTLMWWRHPERVFDLEDDKNRPGFKTSSWFRNEIKSANMGSREVSQELECNFNASGDTVIPLDSMEWLYDGTIDPVERLHWDRNLFVWWKHQPNRRYFVTADVARGDGKDFSAAHVWDIDSMEQQAEYCGRVPPDEFARILCDLGRAYGNALLVVENNTIGMACLEHIKMLVYENVYYSRKGDHRPGESVNTYWGVVTQDLVQGFTTSQKNRPLIISKLEEYIRNKIITIRSKRLVEEFRTFVWNNGRAESMRGYNDDLIMSCAIGVWIRDTFLSPSAVSADVQKRLLDGIVVRGHTNTDIDGASKDPRFVAQRALTPFAPQNDQAPTQIRLPNGQIVDFSWLISKG